MDAANTPERDEGLLAAERLARDNDPGPAHFFQVARVALQLFEEALALHGRGTRERRLLHAAALLHDAGRETNPWQHHKGARDLILSADLAEFEATERKMVACIARYHRKAHPKPTHKVYRDLTPKDRTVVDQMSALLRIADGLDRAHRACTKALRVTQQGSVMHIVVEQRQQCPADIWGANRKRRLFEEVFETDVVVQAEDE